MDTDTPTNTANELQPCSICGRTFRPDTLERHYKICQKSSQKKRKIFDSKKQRSIDAPDNPVPTFAEPKKAPKPTQKSRRNEKQPVQASTKKKPNWREKHEELIRTIRKSRDPDKNIHDEADDSTKRVPSDYVECPGCKRHFNERAADRHIPWCQQKQKQQQQTPKPAASEDAKEKLFARIKYKVPLPGKTKKVKPKTAGPPTPVTEPPIDREKIAYSSPAALMDNRVKNIQNNTSYYTMRKRDYRNGSRSGSGNHNSPSAECQSQIIKFKERFPNHIFKRGVDLEESFTAEQLQELLRCSRLIDTRCPKTVPGVHLSATKGNGWIDGWNKSSLDDSALPEVSSSEFPDSWMNKLGWNQDFEASVSSSGGSSTSSSSGSLPPVSRENTSDLHLHFYCHQCHHRFPLLGAKYCCECGAKRRSFTNLSQQTA